MTMFVPSKAARAAAAVAAMLLPPAIGTFSPPAPAAKRPAKRPRYKVVPASDRGDRKRRLRAEHVERIREQSRIGDSLIIRLGRKGAEKERARRDKLGVR